MGEDGVFTRLRRFGRGGQVEGLSECGDSDEVHVLAVDDSLVDRTVIERLLKLTSCKVTAVESGIRALQLLGLDEEEEEEEESSVGFDDLKVDLIITDYCMPGMTGYELLKKIKGSSVFREIPVVIMSSENILARIHRCLEEGAKDFIVKPVKLSDVKRLKTCVFGKARIQGQDQGGKIPENSDAPMITESPSSSPSLDHVVVVVGVDVVGEDGDGDVDVSSSPSLPSTSSQCSSRSCSSSPTRPSSSTSLDSMLTRPPSPTSQDSSPGQDLPP